MNWVRLKTNETDQIDKIELEENWFHKDLNLIQLEVQWRRAAVGNCGICIC